MIWNGPFAIIDNTEVCEFLQQFTFFCICWLWLLLRCNWCSLRARQRTLCGCHVRVELKNGKKKVKIVAHHSHHLRWLTEECSRSFGCWRSRRGFSWSWSSYLSKERRKERSLCQEGNHEPSLFFSYIQNNASLRVCLQLNFELLCENLLFTLWFIICFMRILEIKILVTTPPQFDYNYVSMWISLCLCFLYVLVLPFSLSLDCLIVTLRSLRIFPFLFIFSVPKSWQFELIWIKFNDLFLVSFEVCYWIPSH